MPLFMSTDESPRQGPDPDPDRRAKATAKAADKTRVSRQTGFLNAEGVERSLLWLALGLAAIAFIVISVIGNASNTPDTSPESSFVELPVIPLPDGDIGGASQEDAAQ